MKTQRLGRTDLEVSVIALGTEYLVEADRRGAPARRLAERVQLAEAVEAHIYVDVGGQRVRSEKPVVLPEGWWCLPEPEDQ